MITKITRRQLSHLIKESIKAIKLQEGYLENKTKRAGCQLYLAFTTDCLDWDPLEVETLFDDRQFFCDTELEDAVDEWLCGFSDYDAAAEDCNTAWLKGFIEDYPKYFKTKVKTWKEAFKEISPDFYKLIKNRPDYCDRFD